MKEGEASSTAFTVLQGVLYIAKSSKHKGLVSKEMEEACLKLISGSEEGRRRLEQLNSGWFKASIPLIEQAVMPQITLHYVLRKRYIEESVLEAIKKGATQVLMLGAGFDTLSYRLAKKFPEISFVELDHPDTYKIKVDALYANEERALNLNYIPVDFNRRKLEDLLATSPFIDQSQATVCVYEGVLMYLKEKEVTSSLTALAQAFKSGVRLIFTAVEPAHKSAHSYGPLLKIYLKVKGEPLSWLCEKEYIPSYLYGLGYTFQDLAYAPTFRTKYLPADYNKKLHEGEYVVIADQHWAEE